MKVRYLPPVSSPIASVDPKNISVKSQRFPSTQVAVAIVLSISGIVSALLLYFFIKRFYRNRYRLSIRNVRLRRFKLEEIAKATVCFSRECWIGSGAFGDVYKGVFDEGTVLAVKRAHVDSYESIREFKNEVELLWRVKHPNLVGLVGYCKESDQKILVYEYVPHGSLLDYMTGRNRNILTWRQRVNIAIGAAKGIAHLHEGVNPSIIHRDIKPSNILIGEGLVAKVSDFGLVKSGPEGDKSYVSSQIKGTPGYLDPAYCASYHLTPFSDVYSFGVILLQLISARPAVDNSRPESRYHIINWARPSLEMGIVEEIIDANLLLEDCNLKMMLKMGQLALSCVAKRPKSRPTMSQVAWELEEALRSCTVTAMSKQLWESNQKSVAKDDSISRSFSINGIGLERFDVDEDDISIRSVAMRCLDVSGIDASHSVDVGNRGLVWISEETDESDTSSGLLV